MPPYRIIAIPTDTISLVRTSQRAPRYGHPTHTEIATGYGPCRHCLRTFRVGEERRILFTYDPFTQLEQVPLPGPVFVHEADCPLYPEQAGYPEDMKPYPALLNAYAKGQRLLERVLVPADADKDAALTHLFERPDVDYVEVRDQTAGCYDFRADRNTPKHFRC